MQRKYRMMHIAASIFRVLGWVVLVVGIIGSIIVGTVTGGGEGAMIAILGIIYSIIGGIFTIAMADFFHCVMDIEENTRRHE
jgi:hypothetical protein